MKKPKNYEQSIRGIGLIVTIFAALITLSNSMGVLVWTILGSGEPAAAPTQAATHPLAWIMDNFIICCLFAVGLGLAFLIGGINIMKRRLWANRLVSLLSVVLIILIMGLSYVMYGQFGQIPEMSGFRAFVIVNGIIWSLPFAALIRYLNRSEIRAYFD